MIRDAELDNQALRREIVESMALQSMVRWPGIAHEMGIAADYWRTQKNRKLMAEAILTAKFVNANGSVPILTTAAGAGLTQEWAAMQFSAAIYDPAQGRAWLRELAVLEQATRLRLRVENVFRKSTPDELEDALSAALVAHQQAHRNSGAAMPSMREITLAYIDAMNTRLTGADHPAISLGPGYSKLTHALRGGFKPGEITVLLGGPGVGKSTMAEDFRRQLARQGIYSLLFSGEMTEEQLAERHVYAECGKRMSEPLTAHDLARAEGIVKSNDLSSRMLVDEQPFLKLGNMLSKLRSEIARVGALGLFIVDHVAKMTSGEGDERKEWELIAKAAVDSKGLAKMTKVAGLLLAHLTTHAGAREGDDWEPMLDDARGGGKMLNEADNVLSIWRARDTTWLKVLKARQNGEARGRKFPLRYNLDVQSFQEV